MSDPRFGQGEELQHPYETTPCQTLLTPPAQSAIPEALNLFVERAQRPIVRGKPIVGIMPPEHAREPSLLLRQRGVPSSFRFDPQVLQLPSEPRALRGIGARMPGGLVRAIAPAALSFIMEGEGSDAMASVKTSKVNPKYKRKYRVRNWSAYERGLRDRGDVTVWLSQEAIEAWTPPPTGRRGGQPRYSSLAIIAALTLRVVFRLPLRAPANAIRFVCILGAAGLLAYHVTMLAPTMNRELRQQQSVVVLQQSSILHLGEGSRQKLFKIDRHSFDDIASRWLDEPRTALEERRYPHGSGELNRWS